MNFASVIDHTFLKLGCSTDDIKRICAEAITHQFAAVKSEHWNHVKNDIDSITIAAHLRGKVIKIVFETSLLTEDEIETL